MTRPQGYHESWEARRKISSCYQVSGRPLSRATAFVRVAAAGEEESPAFADLELAFDEVAS
jgi:hypothetical protein